jgi:hypothetical protein
LAYDEQFFPHDQTESIQEAKKGPEFNKAAKLNMKSGQGTWLSAISYQPSARTETAQVEA